MTAPTLVTPRLILRPLTGADFDDWVAFHGDAETMRFLGGPQPRSVAWRSLCAMAGAWTIRGFGMFAVEERASGRWVGRVGPWQPEGWPGTEVGWGVAPAFSGRGYAFEAAVAAIDFAFDVLGWDDVIHTIHPDNARSIRLAERLGSTRRQLVALPPPLDHMTVIAWGQRAADWHARRPGIVQAPAVSSAG
ncbi:GNAT family N-acetyltransferase [Sphingosinithalassobacter sp. CS137]|uniref:GNAT family N-acetyltransferase n=1 Tax=Sphingosinithalassobacter sp. CS137 TaxID=2762748 RepID=UPI00165DD39D|nr:GNAT family N-acetyltransferase [Sphingosinithalassobacter sp. CS137]